MIFCAPNFSQATHFSPFFFHFTVAAACIILPDGDVSALQVVGATLATVVGLVFVGTGFAVANLQSED